MFGNLASARLLLLVGAGLFALGGTSGFLARWVGAYEARQMVSLAEEMSAQARLTRQQPVSEAPRSTNSVWIPASGASPIPQTPGVSR